MSDKLVTNSLANSAITGNVISSGAVVSSKIATGAITLAKLEPEFASKFAAGVKVTNLYYDGLNTFADVDGGQTITLAGSGFTNNSQVVVNKTMASNVLVTNQYFLTFLAPPNPRGFYHVFVDNQNGATSFLPFGINYIPLIKFYSPSGFFGNLIIPDNSVYEQISAIGDGALTFTLESGSLPSGITLNSNGSITGSTPVTSVGNYNFNVSVFDNNLNKIYRDFFVTLAGGVRLTDLLYSTPSQGNLSAVITGGDTVTFVGGPFLSGGNIIVGNAAARAFTFSSSTTISFTTVATTAGTYDVRINNTNGTYAFRRNFLTFRPPLTWTTPAGLIGTLTELYPFNFSLSASTDASITYSIATGNLPTGISLNSNGLITGTAISGQANVSSLSTYTLTVLATGAFGQNATRTFTVNLYSAPVITGFVFPNNTFAANVGGGQVVTVNGTGFKPGVTLYLDNVIISSTRVASNQLTFTTPAKSVGNYNVYVRNSDSTISSNVLMKFSSVPVWGPASSLPNIDSNSEYSTNIFVVSAATSDSSILYYLSSNINLPVGITLNANTGILGGFTSVTGNLTYSFNITAVDSEFQTTIKSFTVGMVYIPVISAATFKYFDVDGGLVQLKGNDFSRSAVINFDGYPVTTYYQSSTLIRFFAPSKPPGNYSVYITQGSGQISNTFTLQAMDPDPGQIEYTIPGTYTFSYNSFFPNISVVAVGGGGGGVVAGGGGGSSGGGGGGLAWINGLTAYPDDTFTVVVGAGGAGGFNALGQYQGTSGSLSYFGNTSILVGYGGTAPDGSGYTLFPSTLNIPMKTGGRGGAYFASNAYGTYGGGDGGDAGDTATATQFAFKQGGGGGAGGYSGKGGGGGGFNSGGGAATLNSGGGGGGSGTSVNVGGGGGGGVGIYGKGADGAGGGNGQDFFNGGTGGSSGTNGGNGGTKDGGAGGSYGAGGGGAGGGSAPTAGSRAGSGSGGAVRVIWGFNRSFPQINTENVTPMTMSNTGGTSIGTIGNNYTNYVYIGGGTGNITYSVYSGSLPPGITITSGNINGNTVGVISGITPSNANINVYSFRVRATDSVGARKTSNSYTIWMTDQIQSLPFDPFNNFLVPNLAPVWFSPNVSITNTGGTFTANLVAYGLSANIWYSIVSNGNISGLTVSNTTKTISGNLIPNDSSKTFILRATDLVGRYTDRTINIIATPQNEFTVPGTYTWTAPVGVTTVSAVAIGGGGGQTTTHFAGGHGGGGGGLGWKNNITVVPGQQYTVVVGAGGGVDTPGGISYFVNTSTVAGRGGNGRTGGTFVGDGGGNGGAGGLSTESFYDVGGGGGAGGYAGTGGAGGNGGTTSFNGSAGSGGSGGGGAGNKYIGGGGGGGVGIFGQGVSGSGGTTGDPRFTNTYGTAGSDGTNGGGGGFDGTGGGGGLYGGGAGAKSFNTGSPTYGVGGGGAVRILYGLGQTYPITSGPITLEWLVIAGGGGGGGYGGFGNGGGGGAGGVLTGSFSMSTGALFTIIVGAGGGGGAGQVSGSTGFDSNVSSGSFSTLTAKGGGYGGREAPGGNGGSGGGGGASGGGLATQSSFVPAGFTGYGNNGGGNINQFGGFTGGGGGGAAGVGQNGDGETKGGNGGAATSLFSTWASATSTGVGGQYAGGGGGGRDNEPPSGPGLGGGGGATGGGGPDATANTGSGGGGANNVRGYNGGSGIVIARYVSATAKASGGVITLNGGYVYHTFLSSGTLNFT